MSCLPERHLRGTLSDPDHSAADLIVELYRRHAASWDRNRGRSGMERSWLSRFKALVQNGRSVLDLGCGAGEPIATDLAVDGFEITGVDTSAPLIALASARLPKATWIVADMRGLDLGRTYNGIIAWDSFFHLAPDDQRSMFPVFQRHSRTGAALLFMSGPASGTSIGRWHGEPLFHASLAPEEYRLLLASHGFEVVAHVPDDPSCGGHTVWLARSAVPVP